MAAQQYQSSPAIDLAGKENFVIFHKIGNEPAKEWFVFRTYTPNSTKPEYQNVVRFTIKEWETISIDNTDIINWRKATSLEKKDATK